MSKAKAGQRTHEGPRLDISQEVRLAVVMYGGVSLTCYINGVAQELYNLVRATAATDPVADIPFGLAEPDLCDTQKIYRKLSQSLVRGEPARVAAANDRTSPIRTRFRIDILSGSSAGGINAIFLAKGLANNQSIGKLTRLWIEKADIDALLNDRRRRGTGPSSLLDGRYMYETLLVALDEMDRDEGVRPASFNSPNVSELDLYITATDIRGLRLPLRLADKVVYEKRHKKVFHFVYSTAEATGLPRNDFLRDYNPFLAFAARSTSAFPFAFEPETLADIDEPVPPEAQQGSSRDDRWDDFLDEYLRRDGDAPPGDPDPRGREAVRRRAFGDGGYLDNKPFSYAIDALMRRRADVPLERKLLYIEPAPEHPEGGSPSPEGVDVIQNVRAAAITLPRYETIREDLQRVLQRNQLIERIATFTSGIEEDLAQLYRKSLPPPADWNTWGAKDLTEMIRQKGVSFGGYHRLKVAALSDELAAAIALAADLDPDSDYRLALRHLVNAWHERHYVRYRHPSQVPPPQTENMLLVDFDLSYRLRRLMFVRGKMDALSNVDAESVILTKTLLVWHQESIEDGLGEPTLVRLCGAAHEVRAAANLTKVEATPLDKLNLRVLDEAISGFRKCAQELPPHYADLKHRAKALPLEDLREGYKVALEGRQTDALVKALGALDRPLDSFRTDSDSRRRAGHQFQTQAAAWNKAAGQLLAEQWPGTPEETSFQAGFRAEMQELKRKLDDVFGELRRLQQDFWEPRRPSDPRGDANRREHFRRRVRATGLTACLLKDLLDTTEDRRRQTAAHWIAPIPPAPPHQPLDPGRRQGAADLAVPTATTFQAVMDFFRQCVREVTFEAARDCMSILNSFAPPRAPKEPLLSRLGRLAARACARHYYSYYDEYDLVLFPILYQTDVGEIAKVDIFRVSPEDTCEGALLRRLAGTALANFGAFFDAYWRANDILWGRMDGAQRLFDVLLPGPDNKELHDDLLAQAHAAILREVLRPSDQAELSRRLAEALVQASAGLALNEILNRVVPELRQATSRDAKLAAVLRLCLEDQALLDYFRDRYEVDRAFDPQRTLRLLARSTQIVGAMLEGLARRYQVNEQFAAWVTRIGRLFWGIVEVAMPRSTWSLFTHNLLNLLLLMEILLLVGGTLLGNREVQQFALIALAATITFRLGVVLLGQYMQSRRWLSGLVNYLLVPTMYGLACLGVFQSLEIAGLVSKDLQTWVQNLTPRYRLEIATAAMAATMAVALVASGVRTLLTWIRR
jgi:patatin-related protein